jgi:hypothetical protein
MAISKQGCVYAPDATTFIKVTGPTTPPAMADGRQCRLLVINPCLSLSFRVNDPRQVKPNPANPSAAGAAGQTLTTLSFTPQGLFFEDAGCVS